MRPEWAEADFAGVLSGTLYSLSGEPPTARILVSSLALSVNDSPPDLVSTLFDSS